MRTLAIAILGAAALASAALARPVSTPNLPDFAYSVTIRNLSHRTAVCVARDGEAGGGFRLAGLGYDGGMDWAPDGGRFAIAIETPNLAPIRIARADAADFRAATSPHKNEQDHSPRWSPDGARIAFSRYVFYNGRHTAYRRAGLWVLDVAARKERQFSRRFPADKDWSPSGDRLAVGFESDLSLFSAGGQLLWTISHGPESVGEVAWSPTGDLIAARFGRDVLLVTSERTVVQTIVRPDNSLLRLEDGLSWSPDGTRLAVGGGVIFDRSGRRSGSYAPASTMQAVSHAPNWTSDGTTIVYERAPAYYYSWRYGSGIALGSADLYAFPVGGGETAQLTSTPGVGERNVVFRPARGGGTAGTAQRCIYVGTEGPDRIYATKGDDLVSAGPGKDVVHGRGGSDLIVGGDGNDALYGGSGRDEIWGDRGSDLIYARDRMSDRVLGGLGRDSAWIDARPRDSVKDVERVYPSRTARR
jgi:dipeptidyl aminopeptidase/acylaminoacyl peptidase